MKRWFKRIVIGLAALVMVAVVGIAIFLLTFDPNAYKDRLAQAIHDRYDRTLTVAGPLDFSLFPRIGLTLREVSLSEPGSDQVFASVESARLAVAVWPLLFNRLVVDHVTIDGFHATVARNESGTFNFRDLTGALPQDDPEVPEAPDAIRAQPSAGEVVAGGVVTGLQTTVQAVSAAGDAARSADMDIDIAGLALRNGDILFRDAQSGMAVSLKEFNVNTGRVTFGQPFDISWSAKMAGEAPKVDAELSGQALFKLEPALRRYAAQRLDLRLTGALGNLRADSMSLRGGTLAFDGAQRALDVSSLELLFQGDVQGARPLQGVEAGIQVAKLAAYPASWRLQLERMAVRAKGQREQQPFELAVDAPSLDISPSQATGAPLTGRWRIDGDDAVDLSFGLEGLQGTAAEMDFQQVKLDASMRRDDRLIETKLASPLQLQLLDETATLGGLKGDIVITDPGLPKGSLSIPVIGSAAVDFAKDTAKASINAVLEGGKFDLGFDVEHLAKPEIRFALAVDTLDLDKLAPARPAPAAAAPAETTGETDDAEVAPEPEATAEPVQAEAEPEAKPDAWAHLQTLSAKGTIKIGALVARGLKAQDVQATLDLGKGKLALQGLQAQLYGGNLTGSLALASANHEARLKLAANGVALGTLLQDVGLPASISGQADVAADLVARGQQPQEWLPSLSGTARLKVADGVLSGLDAEQWLVDFSDGLKRSVAPAIRRSGATQFSLLEVQANIAKGIATLRRIAFESSYIRVSQDSKPSTVDLLNQRLDLTLLARIQNVRRHAESRQLNVLQGVRVPVHVTGDWSAPEYSVQFKDIVGTAIRGQLQKLLRNL